MVKKLKPEKISVSFPLNSLCIIFATTREILKDARPEVGALIESVGGIAIAAGVKASNEELGGW